MPMSAEDAGAEVQRFLVNLNSSKHSAREKAIRSLRTLIGKQGMEFYDDDVDALLVGDGYMLGLLQWCGESSTGTQGGLKRTAASAIALLKWLVSVQDPSGEDNIFLTRFLQIGFDDLHKMRLELHLVPRQKGGKASSRGGKSEDACEIISLILQHHRDDAGDAEEITVEELLPREDTRKVFMDWLQSTASEKQNTLQSRESSHSRAGGRDTSGMEHGLEGHGMTNEQANAGPDEDIRKYSDNDIPLTWAEVDQDQFLALDEGPTAVVPVDMASKADEPVGDPLGLKQVDLRVYQKTLVDNDTSGAAELNGVEREVSGTLQAKKRALVGQKDRLKLLKRMQTGKERMQRNMEGRRDSRGEHTRNKDAAEPDVKAEGTEISRSVVPTKDNFDPALFMTILHANASFNDIRTGLDSLESAKANQASELQHLVRDHFDNFVRCADSIEKYASQINLELANNKEKATEEIAQRPKTKAELRMQLKAELQADGKRVRPSSRNDEELSENGPAAKSHLKELTRLMESAQREARQNFSQLLQKLDNIKQVRAAQHLLSEKGSILDIPREMSACVTDMRYAELVKLYRKAYTSYSSSILSQVRVEADEVGKRACERLMEVLRSPDVTLEEQINAIGYLQDLQYSGEEPVQACFDSQRSNFLENAGQCRQAMEALLTEACSPMRQQSGDRGVRGRHDRASRTRVSTGGRPDLDARSLLISPRTPGLQASSSSDDLTDSEDFSPRGSSGTAGGGFFDFQEDQLLLAMEDSDDESLLEGHSALEDDGRSEATTGRHQPDVQELDGMEIDEDLAMPVPANMDILTHRLSVARLQHVSNLAWCLGSWIPHLLSLAVFLIRLEQSKSGRNSEDAGPDVASPRVHIRKLCGPGGYAEGTSDLADGETASVATSGTRIINEGASTGGSEDGVYNARREHVGTKAGRELMAMFEHWLNDCTTVLRAAIFGEAQPSDRGTPDQGSGASSERYRARGYAQTATTGGESSSLFAPKMQGASANVYANQAQLKQPLDSRYLRQAFSSLAHLYGSLSSALRGSWERDVILTPGLRSLEKLVKESQALHVRSEMAKLATEAKNLMSAEAWLPPEPPQPLGGTRLPHVFGSVAKLRMVELEKLLPRAEWSAAEITHGLSDAVQCLLSCITALSSHAYETSRMETYNSGAALVVGGSVAGSGGAREGGLSADHQLLCQIGNCLQLDTLILPELWDVAVELFDASRAGVTSDRKRTQKVQEKVMTKYLKRKYRELKMYVKNGWWGYAKTPLTDHIDGSQKSLSIRDLLNNQPGGDQDDRRRDEGRVNATIVRQRTSLRMRRGKSFATGATASVARQASVLSSKHERRASSSPQNRAAQTHQGPTATRLMGMKTTLKSSLPTPQPQPLPSYLVKVLLSLVQARLEAQEALCGLLYRKAGMYEGKMRKDILYADFVLRESAKQVMEIVCDCANARVVGKGHLGTKPLDGSDPVEQAEKIAQAEFLRDALYRFLPSATLGRVNRIIGRLQAGKFEGVLGRNTGEANSRRTGREAGNSGRDSTVGDISLQESGRNNARGDMSSSSALGASRGTQHTAPSGSSVTHKPASVSDSLGAAMPGTFLTATDLQELARVYVVCLK